MSATGRCLCGAVTFTAEEVEKHIHACHCSMCRSWTGGPMQAARCEGVTFSGEGNIKTYKSSEWAERGFCSQCGSSLFYRMPETGMTVMALGAFDDQDQFDLAGEIFVDEKPSGYNFAGDHERLTAAEFLASMGAGE